MSTNFTDGYQTEFQVAINPLNSTYAIATSVHLTAQSAAAYYRTSDKGANWISTDIDIGQAANGDTGIAYAYDGTAYLVVWDYAGPQTIYVLRSDDNGLSWTSPVNIFQGTGFSDRSTIVVDNGLCSTHRGRVYVTYTGPTNNNQPRIYGLYSDSRGASGTWKGPFPVGDTPPSGAGQAESQPRVDAFGNLYVGYQQRASPHSCTGEVMNVVARSTDGGETFSYGSFPITQGGACFPQGSFVDRPGFCYNSNGDWIRSFSGPILGIAPGCIIGPLPPIYVVYSGGDLEQQPYTCGNSIPGEGSHSDILFRKSTDSGATFSNPIKINGGPDDVLGRDQYFPWIDVAPNGTIWVGWSDRREDPNNYLHRWYQAYSVDQGSTWTQFQVADNQSQPVAYADTRNFGGGADYQGLAALNDRVLGVWFDSNGHATGDPYTDPKQVPVLIGSVTWQGRPAQPDDLNRLPITLTLRNGNWEVNYSAQSTDRYGFFTSTLGTLPAGTYAWRAKGPRFLANTGMVQVAGPDEPVTRLDMGTFLTGDANNDNRVDQSDLAILTQTLNRRCNEPGYDDRTDFNGDCIVNNVDLTLLQANFGRIGP